MEAIRSSINATLASVGLISAVGFFFFGLFILAMAMVPLGGLANAPLLRVAAFFFCALALVPAATATLFMRLKKADPAFYSAVTGGWHISAFMFFTGGYTAFLRLYAATKQIALTASYPSALRRAARALQVSELCALVGLLTSAALLGVINA